MHESDSRHLSVVVAAAPATVYATARDLARLPEWAAGLAARELRIIDDATVELDSLMGRVRVEFSVRNELGVLDHTVTLPDGSVTDNPLRVVAHPHGAELIFTVRRGASPSEEFDRDCEMVAADLRQLARLAEQSVS
ncbi:hypothetical protein [Corynebacterium halotolerans]|uniref:hypothetical protein n=1 Tax=Corynebacterium halotolerans TaxID=225326 RepID=UPI003CF4640C